MTTGGGTTTRVRLALEGATAVQQGLAKVEGSVASAAKSIIGLAGGLSVAGFATWIKGAINVADESSKLAQKAGLAVNQVAGLQLAFGQSGVSAEQFVPIMSKLGVAVTNGSKALTAMGIASHNADGSLKSTRQVLGEVSEKFAGYEDGAAKTALAVGLLGEEGAKLLPLLNQGANGLDQYDQMAQQLGLTLDTSTAKAAEQFNDTIDLMGKATSGVAAQVAARLLPTLNTLAGELFRSLVQGDALNTVVDVLSGTMKGLYSVAVGVVTVFKTVGKVIAGVAIGVVNAFKIVGTAIGGIAAATTSLISGDITGARSILSELASDISNIWSSAGAGISEMVSDISATWIDAGASIRTVWDGAGNSTVAALSQANAAMQGAAPVVAQSTAATNKKAEADKRAAEAARQKAEAEKAAAKAAREEADIRARILAIQDRVSEVYANSADQVAQNNQALREEIEAIGQTTAERALSIRLKEREILASKQLELIALQNADADQITLYNLQREIYLREQRLDLLAEQASKEAAVGARQLAEDTVAEINKANEQIAQSLTDSLFDGGKSFLDNLASYARTIVLRPIIAPIGAALGGLLGGPATAATGAASASSLGDAGGLLGNLASISSLAGAFGTGMAASFSSAMAAGVGGWATAAGSLIGTGTAAGISAGLGMIAAPLAAVALAWKPLFGRELAGQGISGDFRNGAFTGRSWQYYEGGLLRDDKTTYGAIDPALQKSLSDRYAAITAGTVAAANALGLDGARANNTYATGLSYDFNGKSQEETDAWFNQMFQGIADYQASIFDGLQALVRDGETASATLQALATSLTSVNAIFDTLGATAYQVSLSGGDMARQLADLFGGIEAFGSSANAYYQAFYSQDERTATTTRQLTTALGALGLQLPATRAGFRDLVEAQDLTTAAGRETYAALLRLSPAFAELTASIEQAGGSVADEINRLRGLSAGSTTAQGYAALQASFATTTAAALSGSTSALAALPGISQALTQAAALQATTAHELGLIRQQTAASLQATLGGLGLQVPSLDVGTNYVPHDMLIMAHRGEAVVPVAYNPAAGGSLQRSALNGAEVLTELRAMRTRLEAMELGLEAMELGLVAVAQHTAKSARILERATPTGDAVLTMTQSDLDAL